MKKNFIVLLVALLILSFVGGYFVGYRYPLGVKTSSDHLLLTRTADYLLSNFYKPLTEEELIKGMVNSLNDPYTVFMNPDETKALQEEVQGEYAGIGVAIQANENLKYPEIVTVFKGTPAEQAGLKVGDIIKEVDGKSTYDLSIDAVSSLVKGKIGTTVTLKIKRDNQELTIDVTRAKVNIPLTETKYLENGKIGYLSMYMFSEGLGSSVEKALNEFKEKGVKGVIVDLRGNPGGLLSECENVASLFLPSGVLLYTNDREGNLAPINVNGKKFDLPLVVLVDGGTASASEIFSGAIKYNKVGKIVGETTYGKGVIQQIYPIKGDYTLKITVEEYLLPDKTSINKKGVTPDIEVKDDANTEEDEQLNKAIEILNSEI